MIFPPLGRLERVVLVLLVLGLLTLLVTGCSAVMLEEGGGGGSGNAFGLPWWAWLLIGIAGALILL